MLAIQHKETRDLFSSVQIPIYNEYLSLTGSYDLTVILNQLSFSQKTELDLYELKRFTLSDKHPKTIREQLAVLQSLGLVSKRKNTLYGRCMYRVRADIYPNDTSLVALIEGYDLKSFPDYLSAAIINKFRTLALSGNDTLTFSINDLKQELKADRCISTIRSIILRLEDNGLISKELAGRVYRYKLNTAKLSNQFDIELINKQSATLLRIFSKYLGVKLSESISASYKTTFRKMLLSGFDYEYLKHIIAYIHKSKYHADRVKTPSHLRYYFEDLKKESYFNLSRRKANRYIYKLINDQLTCSKISNKEDTAVQSERSDIESWMLADKFVNEIKPTLRNWYYKQLAGVSSIDEEDYIHEAKLFLFRHYKAGEDIDDIKKRCSWLRFRLKDFMYKNRALYSREGKGEIVEFYKDDISTIIDYINIKSVEEKSEEYDVNNYVKQLLSKVDKVTRDLLSDYYGLSGKTHNFRDLASKYHIPQSTVHRMVKSGLAVLKTYKPPD